MASTGKKGKKAKAKAVSLQDFLASNGGGATPGSTTVVTKRVSGYDDDYYDDADVPTQIIQLPTAPRASRVFDDESVPNKPPFIAYLSNLPYDLGNEDLEDFFHGLNIVNIRLPREDGDTGRSRGYGYIEFETKADLIDAIQIPDPTIRNRHIRIDFSNENDQRRQQKPRYGDRDRERDRERDTESNWRRGGPGGGGSMMDNDDRRDRYSNRSRYGDSNRPAGSENSSWRSGDRPTFDDAPPKREDGFRDRYGGRRSNYEERRSNEPPRERPQLNLQPRTLPIEPIIVTGPKEVPDRPSTPENAAPKPKPVPAAKVFGDAKPVDTAAKEREIEERLERERQEKLKELEEQREKDRIEAENRRKDEENSKEDDQKEEQGGDQKKPEEIISWRRETNNDDAVQHSKFRRHSPPRDRDRKGGDRRDFRDNDRRDNDRRGNDFGARDNRPRDSRDNRDRRGGNDRDRDRDYKPRGDRDRREHGESWGRRDNDEREHQHNNGNGELDDQKLEDKMPKFKPPEGPNLSMSNKFAAFLDEEVDD